VPVGGLLEVAEVEDVVEPPPQAESTRAATMRMAPENQIVFLGKIVLPPYSFDFV
jgi:hypothetical protein